MTEATVTAERVVRRFARETNLLVAGRDFSVTGTGAVADALRALIPALGGRLREPGGTGEQNSTAIQRGTGEQGGAGEQGTVVFVVGADNRGADILINGRALPRRGTAEERIDAARAHMPVCRHLAEQMRVAGEVRGIRIGIAMVLEPKTAQLALLLQDAGARVAVYAHPDEIDTSVAAVLRTRGIPVEGDPNLGGAAERAAAVTFLRRGFDLLLDDGSHLIRLAHEEGLTAGLRGAAEETTSGLAPLHLMARQGTLEIPVIAVNDAQAKTSFDNRYGTGQSCVFAIADVLDAVGIGIQDQPTVVVGYGPVGEGVAAHLGALGAHVSISETDPVRALRAAHDGYRIGQLRDLAPGALVVSATGAPHTIGAEVLQLARIVAVAGGVPHEVEVDSAQLQPYPGTGTGLGTGTEASGTGTSVPIERVPGGALLIAHGGGVNFVAAEGNPIEIMDLSFAVQLQAVRHLLLHQLAPGVHPLPPEADQQITAAALAARGASLDQPSTAQIEAQRDWRSPRYRPTHPGEHG